MPELVNVVIGNSVLRLFDKHLRTKVHKLRWSEVIVGIKELLSCKFAFSILIISVFVPHWITCIGIVSEVIRRVCDNQLCVGYSINLEVLEVVIE